MKKIILLVVLIACTVFVKAQSYFETYDGWLLITQEDSNLTIQLLKEDYQGIEFWDEIIQTKDFKTLPEAISWFNDFDFKPVQISYDEWEEKIYILLHRTIETTWIIEKYDDN